MCGYLANTTAVANGLLFPTGDGSTSSTNPPGNVNIINPSTALDGVGAFTLWTSTSQQINAVASAASTTLLIVTYGWADTRGRFN